MPQQIPDLAPKLKAMGFAGDPMAYADLTGHPMGAIVSLGGCTASFVSPEGLIATNHHCVVGALQYNSRPDRDLLQNGFLAKTKSEELWNGPGSRVYVTTSVREVTGEITGGLDPKLKDRERFDQIERRVKEQTAACEKDGARCRVASFFDGLRYFEVAQLEIQDVRLVYAPADGIGVFGGETDNWQWPRHTGDWSFYRAYVGKDGKPAPYSKDNVPYRPKQWLRVSPKGASPGDLVFVAGYPGRTYRLQTFGQVKETTEWYYPRAIKLTRDFLGILDEVGKGSKETEIRVAPFKLRLANRLTNYEGMRNGLVRGGLLEKKHVQENELAAWIAADAARQRELGDVLPALAAIQAEKEKTLERDATLSDLTLASSLLRSAEGLYRFALERPKKDIDRDPDYQERNWSRIREAEQRLEKTLDLKADRALLRYVLLGAARLAPDQRVSPLDQEVGLKSGMLAADAAKAIDAFLDRLYAGTKLPDAATRVACLEKSAADLAAAKDSFLDLAIALRPLREEIRSREKARLGALARIGPRYASALLQKAGGLLAPDANSTLRVTFGQVKGVAARDGLFFTPQTTLAGIVAKHTGSGDFNAPRKELDAIAALRAGRRTPFLDPRLGDVPVNFLSTVDTTGGNSGSATLNAKGELCGLLFDGTFDTIASDYLYDTEKTRSIHVDSRYMLWTMAEVDGATNLLSELGIAAK